MFLTTFALLSTGCRLVMELVVNPDGSGETRSILIFTADELAELARFGASVDDLCSGMDASEGTDSSLIMVQEVRGEEIACVGTRAFSSLEEMDRGDESLVINTARIENGRFIYDADLTLAGGDTGEGFPGIGQLQMQDLFQEITFLITAPGLIDQPSSNADSYAETTATWNLTLGEMRNIHLESRAS